MSIKAMPGAAKTFEAIYETPYLSHSPMEPMNATVHLQPDRLDVWVGTQDAHEALEAAANAAGLKPEQVYLHNAFVGGGFGRRDANDEVKQAIAIAKAVQRPVKLIWTREEDTRQDKFRPHAVVALQGRRRRRRHADRVVDARRDLVDLGVGRQDSSRRRQGRAAGDRRIGRQRLQGAEHARRGAHQEHAPAGVVLACARRQPARLRDRELPRRDGARPAASIPIRCGASCSKESPTGSRCSIPRPRRAIGASRCRRAAAAASPSARTPTASARRSPRSRSSPNGEVKVDRVTVALDTRYMVNPLTIAEQAEGSVIFGLSAALYGKITIKNGAPVQGNFDTYPHGAVGGGAEDRRSSRAERRQGLGRRGRARNAADRGRGRERDLRRDRQAHPHAADHRPRSVVDGFAL